MCLRALSLALVGFALPLAVEAQQVGKIPRLCFLTFDPGTLRSTRFGAFFQGLGDLGYVDGQTITIDYLSADGRAERLSALAGECLRLKADVIVVTTTPFAQAAKNAARTTPIVMLGVGDPGDRARRQPRPTWGKRHRGDDHGSRAFCQASRVAEGGRASNLASARARIPRRSDCSAPDRRTELKRAAPSLGVQLRIRGIGTAEDLPAAFEAGAKERAEGLLTTSASIFVVHRARVIELAARHRLPALYSNRLLVDAGGLMAYDANRRGLELAAATYLDRILKGATPADLPVEQPTEFELVINMRTAKALGLTFPRSVLMRADQVIH